MELALRPAQRPWKAALLALLFILVVGFGAAALLRGAGRDARGAMCRCPHTTPSGRCICPPLGSSCACER